MATEIKEYLAAHGGPFYDLQRQLGLLREDAFRAVPRAAVFVTLAWAVPLVLAFIEGRAIGPIAAKPFLLDPGTWARFLIAVGLFLLMELQVETKLRVYLNHFVRAPLISPSSMDAAAAAVVRALKRRDNRTAELVCLVLAGLLSVAAYFNIPNAETESWRTHLVDGVSRLTAAGWWCLVVSNPIFWFLMLRWLWRIYVWAALLRNIANLDLRLTASHPDGRGGLRFIGQYPNVFSTFIFAMSCVVGAAIANLLLHGELSMKVYGVVMGTWLAIALALVAWPLLAFVRPLSKLKQETTLLASAQATNRARLVEREVLGRNVGDPVEENDGTSADIADPVKLYDTAQKLSPFIVNREGLVPVSAAALIPLVAAGTTELPVKELIGIMKHLLLL